MSKKLLLSLLRHEWRSLIRRNFAGLVAGLVPVITSPVVALLCVSITQTIHELSAYGYASSPDYVVFGGLAAIAFFPVMYAVFLASDSIVLETELGTIDLVWWSPVSELGFLLGKALLPFLYALVVGCLNFLLFGLFFVLGMLTVSLNASNLWTNLALVTLPFVASLGLAVMVGLLVSAVSVSTKGAATVSLTVGAVLALSEIALVSVMMLVGIPVMVAMILLTIVTLLGAVGVAAMIIRRLGHRERYFLNVQGVGRDGRGDD